MRRHGDRPPELVRPGPRRASRQKVWWSGGGGDRLHTLRAQGARPDPRSASPSQRPSRRRSKAKGQAEESRSADATRGPLPERPDALARRQDALLARHRRRHHHRDRRSTAGQTARRSRGPPRRRPALRRRRRPQRHAALCLGLGRAGPCWRSTRPTSGPWPGSPSASTRTRSPSIPRTTACSSPAPRATASSVIDTRRGIVTETIATALFPKAPEGSTPDALAVAPDGETLYVANADNNCVAVIDIEHPEPEPGQGLHPHRLVSDGRRRHARRQGAAGRRRQGEPDPAQPDRRGPRQERSQRRRAAESTRAAVPVHRHHALGRLVDRAGPRRQDARRLHRDGLPQLPLLRQAPDQRPVPARRRPSRPRSATRRRSSTSSTSSRRTGPTTRSSATSPRQRRPQPW